MLSSCQCMSCMYIERTTISPCSPLHFRAPYISEPLTFQSPLHFRAGIITSPSPLVGAASHVALFLCESTQVQPGLEIRGVCVLCPHPIRITEVGAQRALVAPNPPLTCLLGREEERKSGGDRSFGPPTFHRCRIASLMAEIGRASCRERV